MKWNWPHDWIQNRRARPYKIPHQGFYNNGVSSLCQGYGLGVNALLRFLPDQPIDRSIQWLKLQRGI